MTLLFPTLVLAQKTTPLASETPSIFEYEQLVKSGLPLNHEDSILIAFGQIRGKFLSLPLIPSPYGKCGTELAFEVNRIPINKQLKAAVILSSSNVIDSIRSPSGRFTIFFEDTGQNAATREYVDSIANYADEAFQLEISQLGYPKPPFSYADSTWHINIQDMGSSGIYGFTQPTGNSFSSSKSGLPRFRAENYIDNDFSETAYPTHGFDAARITVFHEFQHIIQYGDFGFGQNDINFREMTSVWMEMRSTPEVKDYLQYIWQYLQHIDTSFNLVPGGGYSESIWMQYLQKKFGDDIIKMVWEFYSDKNSNFQMAFDSVLEIHGSNFCTEYDRFGTALYYTGNRVQDTSIFPDAREFPIDKLKLDPLSDGIEKTVQTLPASLQIFTHGEHSADTTFNSATQDTIIKIDTSVITISRSTSRTHGTAQCTVLNTGIGSFQTTFEFPELFCDSASLYKGTEIIPKKIYTKVFPQPYILTPSVEEQPLAFLASVNSYPPSSVFLTIYSSDNSLIRSIEKNIAPQSPTSQSIGGSWYAEWDGRDDTGKPVPTGVYFYSILTDGKRDGGKFVLIRKN